MTNIVEFPKDAEQKLSDTALDYMALDEWYWVLNPYPPHVDKRALINRVITLMEEHCIRTKTQHRMVSLDNVIITQEVVMFPRSILDEAVRQLVREAYKGPETAA